MFYSILSLLLFHGVLMFYSILSLLLFYVLLHLICILLPLLHWSVCLSLYCVEFEWPKRRKIKPFYAFIMNNNVIWYCILIIWENILRNFHLARFIHSVWLICQIHDLLWNYMCMIWNLLSLYLSVLPWYNRTGWLGVKHQLTYLRICLSRLPILFVFANSPLHPHPPPLHLCLSAIGYRLLPVLTDQNRNYHTLIFCVIIITRHFSLSSQQQIRIKPSMLPPLS